LTVLIYYQSGYRSLINFERVKMSTVEKIYVPIDERPKCSHKGCNDPGQHKGNYRKDGYPMFRKLCTKHHSTKTAKKHGCKTLAEVVAKRQGYKSVNEYHYNKLKERAKKLGYKSLVEFLNASHPYRKYRKDYCENRDGRLGFKCRYKIRNSAQLQVDHINGKPNDNREKNLQTLCCNCHVFKTYDNKDYLTPGRKSLKKLFTDLI